MLLTQPQRQLGAPRKSWGARGHGGAEVGGADGARVGPREGVEEALHLFLLLFSRLLRIHKRHPMQQRPRHSSQNRSIQGSIMGQYLGLAGLLLVAGRLSRSTCENTKIKILD